jgi:CCR4-NOT transcription complex subunit 6
VKDEGSDTSGEGVTESHPSSTSAPVTPAQRPESSWFSLDMGGINLKNLPRSNPLFSYNFLLVLYLPHNNLTSIPPEIATLKHLELLDLSCNQLMSIPPEMGLLTNLRELLLFDNNLVTLPSELGTLFQLRMLGIEGNPLDSNLKKLVQEQDTQSLIAYLRDNCPLPERPPDRMWRVLQSEAERKAQDADPNTETLSVLCYNILCERCATERLYGYTPSWALAWKYRKQLILSEVLSYNADFLCLQEVDVAQYEDYFLPKLMAQDYEGVFWPKSRAHTMDEAQRRLVDGCATFYKASK